MRQAELFIQADQQFTQYVGQITADQWDQTVPSTPDWSVRELVDHVAHNNLAVLSVLGQGAALQDDDLLGDDPGATWARIAQDAEDAAGAATDPDQPVDGPLGQTTLGDFMLLQTVDRTVHAWDLAHAIGADEALEPAVIQAAYDFILPGAEAARNAGIFGAEVAVGPDATLQERLLAVTGRDPGYAHEEPVDDSERAEEIHRS